MKKIINYFIPEKYKEDTELFRKSRFVIWFLFLSLVVSNFFAVVIYLERPEDIINLTLVPAFFITFGSCLWLFRKTGAFLAITHIVGVFFILGTILIPFESGGIFSPDMPTIYIIPIFALIMGNLFTGFLYTFLMYAGIFLIYFMEKNGLADFRGQTEEIPSEYYLFNLILNALMILFLVFRNEILRLKAVNELKESNETIAHKNKEITDSINYARRIQSAILPQKEYVKQNLPDSFFFYKPKDIVSGDFYWMSERNGDVYLAVADCTGHGIPGAFMSVVGMNLLNEIVNHRNISQLTEILKELNAGVVSALQQKQTETNDGMDIALVKIPKVGGYIEYAAANRGLILFRNGTKEEYKPSKYPIGGFNSMMEKQFETHRIPTQPNDIFYLSTDGFADQFGGSKNKKLTTRNFKRKLEQISSLQLADQENELDNFFTDWKKGYEQTDDVLVAGIRIKN